MDDATLYTFVICLFVVLIVGAIAVSKSSSKSPLETKPDIRKKTTHNPNLIQDEGVTTALAIENLKKFTPTIIQNRKGGFSEADIQSQLEKYFKGIFQNVTPQHGIETKNTKAIDFDIGNGKVGIELKIADKILKESESDRIFGQMIKYQRAKYNQKNLVIAIAGFDEDFRNSLMSDIEDDILENNAIFVFLNAGSKDQIQYEKKTRTKRS